MKKDAKQLAKRLFEMRKSAGETIFEVSMAVEVQENELKKYESGESTPSDSMLSMLLSHYDVSGKEADELFDLAGYSDEGEVVIENMQDEDQNGMRISVPADAKVLYSDMVQVMSNRYGVVINFMQLAPGNNAQVVSRVGMSKEHVKSLIELLEKNLEDSKEGS